MYIIYTVLTSLYSSNFFNFQINISLQASIEIDKIMKQPIEHYSKHDDMQNYIDSKINAIDDLLPKWTSLPSDFMSDEVDEDSNFGDDYNTAPPPLPPQQSRR